MTLERITKLRSVKRVFLAYLPVRQPRMGDVRGELYKALELMPQVVDHEMSTHDLSNLEEEAEEAGRVDSCVADAFATEFRRAAGNGCAIERTAL